MGKKKAGKGRPLWQIAVVVVAVLLVVFVAAGSWLWLVLYPMQQDEYYSGLLDEHYASVYGNGFEWIKSNTPEGAVVASWWDYGSYLEENTGRTAVIKYPSKGRVMDTIAECYERPAEYQLARDPLNLYRCGGLLSGDEYEPAEKVEDIARMYVSIDEDYSLSILKKYGADYVVVMREDVIDKFSALAYVADAYCVPEEKMPSDFTPLAELTAGACDTGHHYMGEAGFTQCSTSGTGHECWVFEGAPLQFTAGEWDSIKATPWPGHTLRITSALGQEMKMRVHGLEGDGLIFFKANNMVVPDAPVNYAYAFRLFVRDPSLTGVKLVYADDNMVVYEVLS